MPALRFRDRFYSPPVARAVTSPSAILSAGGGGAAGILAAGAIGLATGPVAVVGLLGAALAYGVRVALAIPKQDGGERIDPFGVNEPWRGFVSAALRSRVRFGKALRTMQAGPLRDHLDTIGGRIDDAVDECWRIAKRGQLMTDARSSVDEKNAQWELRQVQQRAQAEGDPDGTVARTVRALEAQIASAQRMDRVITETRNRLQLLDARLDETITRTIELSVQADSPDELDPLGDDVEGIVTEMEALRAALEETEDAEDGATTPTVTMPAPKAPPPPTGTTWPPTSPGDPAGGS